MSDAPIQLTLDDALTVVCPRCHYEFEVQQAVRKARLALLPPATLSVWEAAGPRFRRGLEHVGPSELAARANLTAPTILHHLSILVAHDLVRRIPQNPHRARLAKQFPQHRLRVRHVYTGNTHQLHLLDRSSNIVARRHATV